MRIAKLAGFCTGSMLILSGCVSIHRETGEGETRTMSRTIERGKAESVRTIVRMGVGELDIAPGAEKLLEGEFRVSPPFSEPKIRYDDSSFRGHLTIEQGTERSIRLGKQENEWSVRLHPDTPMDVEVHLGVGESRLNLGKLDLRRVSIHMGVGRATVDLRGTPKKDYDLELHGGVGEATVYLPQGVGVRASARGGLGQVSVAGDLRRDGSDYTNALYGKAGVNVRLELRGGVGEIRLIAE